MDISSTGVTEPNNPLGDLQVEVVTTCGFHDVTFSNALRLTVDDAHLNLIMNL